jgi:hypothetical protein
MNNTQGAFIGLLANNIDTVYLQKLNKTVEIDKTVKNIIFKTLKCSNYYF